ncbi:MULTISPECIES: hypothetical protein [Streptomyces]|uniref:hypothetical protein n=1 Tax=Streptomyces TaxID=1883 RepID=UPI0029B01C3C|nr:hypothetical protein [Streptomyces sp. NE06-03C]MDX2922889.1 hypothetical protein [Streptomyces sp. NE06-03C]
MTPKLPLHISAVHWLGFGIVAGFFVNSLCLLATGDLPSPWAGYLGALALTLMSSAAFIVHERQRRAALEAKYLAPALGDGIDTPHRPPADDPKS